jgi:outer membrane protein, heavy metal efflux system
LNKESNAVRFWAGLLIVALAGCQSGSPAAPPIQLAQSPQMPAAPVPAPQPIRPDLVMAATSELVRPASFESAGETGIRVLPPRLAQAEPIPKIGSELSSPVAAEPISPVPLPLSLRAITIDEALSIALAQNPDLAVTRQDIAIAQGQRVVANTYPFNPTFETQIQAADNFGLAQHIRQSYTVLQEFERGGKGGFRRGQANAAVQRTEWEQRARELAVAADVYRRFQGVLFAHGRLELTRETGRLNQKLAKNARTLLQAGKVSGADLIIAEQEALDSRKAEAIGEAELRTARLELRSVLGIADELQLEPQGDLHFPPQPSPSLNGLIQRALDAQPEVIAKGAALQQASAAVGLAIASQKADVTFGPAIEVDENKTFFIGGTLQVPLQIYNKKEGEVLQAEAERAKAAAELEQVRIKVKMAVLAAWQQYDDARRLAATIAGDVLPTSDRYLQDAEKLQSAGQIDLLKLVELRRRRLLAQEQLLEAQNQMVLRQIDLETLSGRLLSPELISHESPPLPPPDARKP